MNRRFAFRDHHILVAALPHPSRGWIPEICILSPDAGWRFVCAREAPPAGDPARCLELGRHFAENAIRDQQIEREVSGYGGHWH